MTIKRLKNLMVLALSVSLVIGAALTSGCAGKEIETPPQIIEDITPQGAFDLIQENRDNPDFVILDVQAPEHFAGGHIENAINIDYYSETFQEELNKLDKNKTYVVYYTCHCGEVDTETLRIMKKFNFREVYNISDGLVRWKSEGFPTVKN